MKVDVQCHVFPKAYGEFFVEHAEYPKSMRVENRFVFDFDGYQTLVMADPVYDPKAVLAAMDKAKIDLSLITCNVPDPGMLPDEYAVEAAKLANDEVAEIIAANPDRFAGIAFLPWTVPVEAMKELDRIEEMGFKSVMLFSHNGEMQVDDPLMLPVYKKIEEMQIPVTIHPSIPLWSHAMGAYGMVAGVGLPMDTSLALIRLVKSGILEKYPKMRMVMPHAGGVLPYLDGRLSYVPPMQPAPANTRTVPDHMRNGNIYFDTSNVSEHVLGYARGYLGSDKLMYGSDYPFVEPDVLSDLVEKVFPKEELEGIFWKTANEVYHLGL